MQNIFIPPNINKNTPLIFLISGGPDSMMMLDYFKSFFLNIRVIYFNHQTSDTSLAAKNLVSNYCAKFLTPFEEVIVPKFANNFHQQSRNYRYEYVFNKARIDCIEYIFTAHHLDDLTETIILKLIRGGSFYNTSGMQLIYHEQTNNITLVKPLLNIEKTAIYNYLNTNNIPYIEDPSNKENFYTRNIIRNEVIPILKQINPSLNNTLKLVQKRFLSLSYLVCQEAKLWVENYRLNKRLNIAQFNVLNYVVKEEIIHRILSQYNFVFSNKTIENIIVILETNNNNKFEINRLISLIVEDNLWYFKTITKPDEFIYEFAFETPLIYKHNKFILQKNDDLSKGILCICYNNTSLPFYLRSIKNGDTLCFDYGHKKLVKFLAEKQIYKLEKKFVVVLADRFNIHVVFDRQFNVLYHNKTIISKQKIYLKMELDETFC